MDVENLKKACTETLIINLLLAGPMHGYQMAKEVERRSGGYFVFKHGTLYPILHKLEKRRLIKGRWSAGKPGERPRKYYELTQAGHRCHQENTAAWREFFRVMGGIIPEAVA